MSNVREAIHVVDLARLWPLIMSRPKPTSAMMPTPAKHAPVKKIIFANWPPATSNPKRTGLNDEAVDEVAVRLRWERAVEIGVDITFPIPRVKI